MSNLDHYKVALNLSSLGCNKTESSDYKVTNFAKEQDRSKGECQNGDNHTQIQNEYGHRAMSGDCIDMSEQAMGIQKTDTDIHSIVECQSESCSHVHVPSFQKQREQQDVNNCAIITSCQCDVCLKVVETQRGEDQVFQSVD